MAGFMKEIPGGIRIKRRYLSKRDAHVFVAAIVFSLYSTLGMGTSRTWKSDQGTALEAELVGIEGDQARLKAWSAPESDLTCIRS